MHIHFALILLGPLPVARTFDAPAGQVPHAEQYECVCGARVSTTYPYCPISPDCPPLLPPRPSCLVPHRQHVAGKRNRQKCPWEKCRAKKKRLLTGRSSKNVLFASFATRSKFCAGLARCPCVSTAADGPQRVVSQVLFTASATRPTPAPPNDHIPPPLIPHPN